MTLKITSDNIASATLSTLGGGVKITTVAYPGSVTAASPEGGETITVTGSGFNSGIIVYINNTIPCATTYINSTSLTFVAPATSVGTYNIVLYNTDGSSGVKPIGIIFSSLPSWVTASGALTGAPISTSYNQSVSATGDGTITYSLTSGSLPSGLSLNSSSGAITGTAPTLGSATTYNFTITASDSQNQTAARAFSITVTVSLTSVEYLVVAGGGGAVTAGASGAGGLLTNSGFAVTAGTPYTVTVGAGGVGSAQGGDSIFSTVTAKGGGAGSSASTSYAGGNGGSGGAGAYSDGNNRQGGKGVYPGSTYINAPRQGYDGTYGTGDGAGSHSGGGGGGAGGIGTIGNPGVAGAGGIGYLSTITTSFVGTATTNSTTTLNITGVTTGEIQVGTQVTGTGIPAGAFIVSLGTGTGGTGTYIMNAAATASASGVAITSSGRYFAGGGGGQSSGGDTINGGAGGGGSGTYTMNTPINYGKTNTGGGAGGTNSQGVTLNGGSGVVIIRYADTYSLATSTTGSPTITTAGGYRTYKFTASGTITF
jgi:hypothetical protein